MLASLQLRDSNGPIMAPLMQETPPSSPPPEPARSNGAAGSFSTNQVGAELGQTQSACSSPVDQRLTESVDEKRARTLGRVDSGLSPVKQGRSHSGASPSKIMNWFRKKKADKTLSSPQRH